MCVCVGTCYCLGVCVILHVLVLMCGFLVLEKHPVGYRSDDLSTSRKETKI